MNYDLKGLYVITDARYKGPNGLAQQVEQAILGGARIVQYRDKSDDQQLRKAEALAVHQICQAHQVPLIINDDVELARQINAEGVHVGIHDMSLTEARKTLGNDFIIGVSCYNQAELGKQAAEQGADYIAFGSCYPSPTKPDAVKASADVFTKARKTLDLPIVAIGGIKPENGQPLIEAGADMLAVISDVFAHDDVRSAAEKFKPLF